LVVVQDAGLPHGVRARITRVDGMTYLRIRNAICDVGDATLMAHELGHVLQMQQGFPALTSATDHPAATSLNSALHDPLVDAKLSEYGFDIMSDRRQELDESRRQLATIQAAPRDAAGSAHWIANCLGRILEQHTLGRDQGSADFLKWFEARYPGILGEAHGIAAVITREGFETPTKMYAALSTARAMLGAGGGVIGPPVYPHL
jgi:hypothetical protein